MKIKRLPSVVAQWAALLSLALILSLALLPQRYEAAEAALVPGSSLKDKSLLPASAAEASANQEAGASVGIPKNEATTGASSGSGGGGNQVLKIGSNIPLPPAPENF